MKAGARNRYADSNRDIERPRDAGPPSGVSMFSPAASYPLVVGMGSLIMVPAACRKFSNT
ncbi:hypothetical protein AWB82_01314 [Caballeronia glebae]|uniref:Uncharacterized protein n=1 Tax=Caballeronia glebae TaxID=1777143 RepID=A0A157ZW59_9BURK|nr:hypothetical protein AWB82_01314 [Caballeronia glebae]